MLSGFITLNDGSYFSCLQVVIEAEKIDNYAEIAGQNVGAAVVCHGIFTLTPRGKQPFELKAMTVAVEGASSPEYPLQKKGHSLEFLRDSGVSAAAQTFSARCSACAARRRLLFTSFFHEQRLRLRAHTDNHGQRLRGRRRDVPASPHSDIDNPPRTEDGKVDYIQRTFSASRRT